MPRKNLQHSANLLDKAIRTFIQGHCEGWGTCGYRKGGFRYDDQEIMLLPHNMIEPLRQRIIAVVERDPLFDRVEVEIRPKHDNIEEIVVLKIIHRIQQP